MRTLENGSRHSGDFESLSNEIEKLRWHISNGCVSEIEPGAGTSGNERIHRCLNRCLLCGTSVVGPELAIAILTTLFYSLNMKRKREKHFKNYRVVPHVPLDVHQSERHETAKKDNEISLNDSTNKEVPAKTEAEAVSPVTLDPENDDIIIMADDITHLLSDSIGKK